jgi:hypothetical protein
MDRVCSTRFPFKGLRLSFLEGTGSWVQIPPSRLGKTVVINHLENERKRVSAHFLRWCSRRMIWASNWNQYQHFAYGDMI